MYVGYEAYLHRTKILHLRSSMYVDNICIAIKIIMVLKSIMLLNCAVSNHFKSGKFTLIIYNIITKTSIITLKHKIKIDQVYKK